MTTEARTDPFDIGPADTPEQRIAYLEEKFDKHRTDPGVPVLGEEELLVVAELPDRLNELTNPDGNARDRWAGSPGLRRYASTIGSASDRRDPSTRRPGLAHSRPRRPHRHRAVPAARPTPRTHARRPPATRRRAR